MKIHSIADRSARNPSPQSAVRNPQCSYRRSSLWNYQLTSYGQYFATQVRVGLLKSGDCYAVVRSNSPEIVPLLNEISLRLNDCWLDLFAGCRLRPHRDGSAKLAVRG